jgi:ElaB/YqjD/DUF883 family membrane-anchored ribosome-binding protein
VTQAEENTSRIEDELQDVQSDLRDTLSQVSAKAEAAVASLRPDEIVKNHSGGAMALACALGFLTGSIRSSAVGPVLIAVSLGFAVSKVFRNESMNGK